MSLQDSPRIKVARSKVVHATDEEIRAVEKSMDDPIYWFEHHCRTQDQHRQDLRSRPFPKYSEQPYLYKIIEYIHTLTRIAIPKSRQMMLSWTVVAYLLWATQFHMNVWTFFVSLKRSHASKLVSRAKFIYRFQGFNVGALDMIHTVQTVRKDIGTTYTFPFYPNREEYEGEEGNRNVMSLIEGLSQDPEEIRMNTATYVMYDEVAFQPRAMESHRAIHPALGDYGTIIDVSSPNGKNHFFAMVHDLEGEDVMY